ncbi:unnamed protein product [Protopolystoma xenopodis]|uniref:Uncharacterized protein n=1 Tax=Protopolystoma xenopodis TaxID=117903 RepID=A0A3S5FBV6_9PLAT|nr:unnamed protein product [Protopolystoma xenopodis]
MPAPPGSLPYTLRANARRAKQLTALANLERRLFGPPAASISSNLQSSDDVAIDSNSSPIDVDSSGLSGLCPIVPSISPLSGSRAADFHEEPSANHSLSSPPHAPSNIRNISSPSSSNSLIFDPEELDPGCRLFRPLVPYSLHLTNLPLIDRHFSQSNSPFSRPPPTAVWTPAVRSTYLDLPGAPRELLGFSAILSHGAVFVFSGFSDDQTSADQSTLPRHQPSGGFRSPESLLSGSLRPSQSGQSWPANNLVSGSLAQGVRLSPITVRSKPQSAKLYVLQPRRLVDVLAFYH